MKIRERLIFEFMVSRLKTTRNRTETRAFAWVRFRVLTAGDAVLCLSRHRLNVWSDGSVYFPLKSPYQPN